MDEIRIEIDPVPAPRMSRSDVWKRRKCVLKYRAYRDHIRMICNLKKFEISDCELEFHFEIPNYLKNKILPGELKRTRPDIDNLVKAIFDALLEEDGHIARFNAVKKWSGNKGFIIIRNIKGLS